MPAVTRDLGLLDRYADRSPVVRASCNFCFIVGSHQCGSILMFIVHFLQLDKNILKISLFTEILNCQDILFFCIHCR